MKSKRISSQVFPHKNKVCITLTSALSLLTLIPSTQALEVGGALHKGSNLGLTALSLHVTDSIKKGSPIHWSAAYNYINGINVDWNNKDRNFNTSTVDTTLIYRHKVKSYSKFFQKISIDYQAGLSLNLTDNKFKWPEVNGQVAYEEQFSKKNDINAVIAVTGHYKFDHAKSMHVGIKHLPSFSDFRSISTVYVGFTYRFVNAFGY